jgi:hypothetical protein
MTDRERLVVWTKQKSVYHCFDFVLASVFKKALSIQMSDVTENAAQ